MRYKKKLILKVKVREWSVFPDPRTELNDPGTHLPWRKEHVSNTRERDKFDLDSSAREIVSLTFCR